MRGKRFAVGLTTALLMVVAPVAQANPVHASTASAESLFVAKINGLRAAKGLTPLAVHPELVGIGRRWAAAMAAKGSISHNPSYSSWVTSNWQKLGENVGVGPSVEALHPAFVASPSHYRNLVDPAFRYIGVGVVMKNGRMFTSHQFMSLRGSTVSASAPATPSTTAARAASAPRGYVAASSGHGSSRSGEVTSRPVKKAKPKPQNPERTMRSLRQLRVLAPGFQPTA